MTQPKNITLELSLKPFKKTDDAYIEQVCRTLFEGWKNLLIHTDTVKVMFWTADGSEILDYRGNLDDSFEWCQFIGGANPLQGWNKKVDPEGIGLHTTYNDYIENPPKMTYRILKQIIATIKRVGNEITGKPVLVGETFDPGPEFAKSSFKYTRHREICEGASMGSKTMVCCYYTLNKDDVSYAAYPNGIPDGTPIGTFLGKQSEIFLKDMDFDYIWLSNGFGFGTETWGVTGALFDGKEFYPEKLPSVEKNIMKFWELFTKECHYPIETRGTNLTTGIDYSSDGVNHKMIYENYDILPPPNSPWAALDGNFGLEIAGYLSRMAKLPGGKDDYLFRFYTHDPWWYNSPWIDRYEGLPHDIYLPMACSRINDKGEVIMPSHLNILSADDSLGDMPERVPFEVTPYLLSGYELAPDAPSPYVWVYPFDEYNTLRSGRLTKSFYEDWYLIAAVNRGLPVSQVISTDNFAKLYDGKFLKGSVLVSPVPEKGSVVTKALCKFAADGGKILFYGSLKDTDDEILDLLGLELAEEKLGIFTVTLCDCIKNELRNGEYSNLVKYAGSLSDGGACAVLKTGSSAKVLCSGECEGTTRILASVNGNVMWTRGKDCSRHATAANDAVKADTTVTKGEFPMETMLRHGAAALGFRTEFSKYDINTKEPVIMMHRHNGSVFYSGCCADTSVEIKLSTPLGAPLLLANEAILEDGMSCYHLPRAWRHECRVFVKQQSGSLHCIETTKTLLKMTRRLQVNNLKDATVYVLPKNGDLSATYMLLNSPYPNCISDDMDISEVDTCFGKAFMLKNVTGTLEVVDTK